MSATIEDIEIMQRLVALLGHHAELRERVMTLEAERAKDRARIERLERLIVELSLMQEACAGRFSADPHQSKQSWATFLEAQKRSDPHFSAIANDLAEIDRERGGK